MPAAGALVAVVAPAEVAVSVAVVEAAAAFEVDGAVVAVSEGEVADSEAAAALRSEGEWVVEALLPRSGHKASTVHQGKADTDPKKRKLII